MDFKGRGQRQTKQPGSLVSWVRNLCSKSGERPVLGTKLPRGFGLSYTMGRSHLCHLLLKSHPLFPSSHCWPPEESPPAMLSFLVCCKWIFTKCRNVDVSCIMISFYLYTHLQVILLDSLTDEKIEVQKGYSVSVLKSISDVIAMPIFFITCIQQ